jgi:hypothetical protein
MRTNSLWYRQFRKAAAGVAPQESARTSLDRSEALEAPSSTAAYSSSEAVFEVLATENLTFPERPNSMRAVQFAALMEAIRRMADLPPRHEYHLDAETAKRAQNILGQILQNFSNKPPRLFPHEGESLVMTWDEGDIKRLLTIAGEELDILDLNKRSQVRCSLEFDLTADQVGEWFPSLGGVPNSLTFAGNKSDDVQ